MIASGVNLEKQLAKEEESGVVITEDEWGLGGGGGSLPM